MTHYLREFPDYDAELPTLTGFVDDSWHNDTCPSLFNATYSLKLWCEYVDVKRRTEGSKRFILFWLDDEGCMHDEFLAESDNLDDIKKAIEEATL